MWPNVPNDVTADCWYVCCLLFSTITCLYERAMLLCLLHAVLLCLRVFFFSFLKETYLGMLAKCCLLYIHGVSVIFYLPFSDNSGNIFSHLFAQHSSAFQLSTCFDLENSGHVS